MNLSLSQDYQLYIKVSHSQDDLAIYECVPQPGLPSYSYIKVSHSQDNINFIAIYDGLLLPGVPHSCDHLAIYMKVCHYSQATAGLCDILLTVYRQTHHLWTVWYSYTVYTVYTHHCWTVWYSYTVYTHTHTTAGLCDIPTQFTQSTHTIAGLCDIPTQSTHTNTIAGLCDIPFFWQVTHMSGHLLKWFSSQSYSQL